MLLEIVQGGELFDLLARQETGTVPLGDAWFYSACVISAFEHMQSKNVVYRDLKPENLMLDRDGYIKVVDFRFAKVLNGRTHTLCGTPEYFSPELVKGKGYGLPTDVWGIGILLYEMLAGYTPFADMQNGDPTTICKNIVRGRLKINSSEISDPTVTDLLKKILVKDPLKRLGCGAKGMKEIMDHTWFKTLNWEKLERKRYDAPWKPPLKSADDVVDPSEDYAETVSIEPYTKDSSWCAEF